MQNWISSCDREFNTALWLKYEKYDRDHVASINCSICTTFDEKIRGSRNYNDAFIVGSTNLHTSSFRDHAKTDMHQRAMILFRKSQGWLSTLQSQRHFTILPWMLVPHKYWRSSKLLTWSDWQWLTSLYLFLYTFVHNYDETSIFKMNNNDKNDKYLTWGGGAHAFVLSIFGMFGQI